MQRGLLTATKQRSRATERRERITSIRGNANSGENDGRRDPIRQSRRPRDVRFGASGERLSNNPTGTRRAGKRRDRGAKPISANCGEE